VNDNFILWLSNKYRVHGEAKATLGNTHDYLGMTFIHYGEDGVTVDMRDYIKNIINVGNKTAPTWLAFYMFRDKY
jgi:hypothetical protein